MITNFKKSHKKIFKKNKSRIRNKFKKKNLKTEKNMNNLKKKSKKNQSGGALESTLPEFGSILNTITGTLPDIQSVVTGVSSTGKGIDILVRGFSKNLVSDFQNTKNRLIFLKNLINYTIYNPIVKGANYLVDTTMRNIVGNLSSGQMATLGLGAGISALYFLYTYSQMPDQQLIIDKKRKAGIVSKKIDEFVKLEDIKMNDVRTNYYDEELLLQFDNDPYYKYRQGFKKQKKNKIKLIYDNLKFIGNKKNITEKVEKIKKIKDLIILIKKQPYLLEENTDLCFSKNLSGVNGIPLLFCIFNVTNDLRILKLVLNIYVSGTLNISENETILDSLRTTKHNFSVLDYLLSRKIKENNESFPKIIWLISKLNYTSISYQTIYLFFKYIRECYRLKIYGLKKKNPREFPKLVIDESEITEEFDYFYKKFKTFRHTLVNCLQILLVKYSQNQEFEYDNLFDTFLELLTIEKNILPLDIHIIESLIMNNFGANINQKNKDKFKNLKLLETELMNQNQSKVIKNLDDSKEIKKDNEFEYGQIGLRIDDENILDFDSYKKIRLNYQRTTGLYCSLKSNINYHYHRFKQNSEDKSVTPYILFPINKQEMEYEYMNTPNVNHSYTQQIVSKSETKYSKKITTTDDEQTYLKYMSNNNITCTRIFETLDAAIKDSHYYQVYFLNRPFKMRLVNNFIIYIKKTKKSYVKVKIDIKFKGSEVKTYYFWVLRNDIDFKYADFNNEEITNENKDRKHLQITKERFIVRDKDSIRYGSWGEYLLLTGGWISNLIGKVPRYFGAGLILGKQQKTQLQINKNKEDIGTINILSYKDINIVTARNSHQLSNQNNQHNVVVLIFKGNHFWNRSNFINEVEQFIKDGIITREYFDQIIEFKISLFINKSTKYVYLENGNVVLLKVSPGDYSNFLEIIKVFLSSTSKKNLIIPSLVRQNIDVKSTLIHVIKKSIDQFFEDNYHLFSNCLSKSIIIVSTVFDYSKSLESISNKFLADETREITPYTSLFVETKHNLMTPNAIIPSPLRDNFYNIYDYIVPSLKEKYEHLDVKYDQIKHILSVKNNSKKIFRLGTDNFLFSLNTKNKQINSNEILNFSLWENYLQGDQQNNPRYIAISSTTIN